MELHDYLSARYAPQTVRLYQWSIANYLASHPSAADYRYPELVAAIGSYRERHGNARTLRRTLSSLKVYYGWLAATGVRADNPALSVQLRDPVCRDVQLQDLLTQPELDALAPPPERYPALTLRNAVILSLLRHQAPLAEEIASLTPADINLTAATIHFKGTRRTNARTLPLQASQILLLHQWLTDARPALLAKASPPANTLIISHIGTPMPVSSFVSHFRRYRPQLPEKALTMGKVRQSVIALKLKTGHDLRLVQVFAGHQSPATTEKYRESHLAALQNAILRHHPFA